MKVRPGLGRDDALSEMDAPTNSYPLMSGMTRYQWLAAMMLKMAPVVIAASRKSPLSLRMY
ncbi:hypothetical protein GCM10011408_15750 [Dyella caseinilytica]|nr:hypothetical protein GCM10011408_15750 [Dyella caseinilytica]